MPDIVFTTRLTEADWDQALRGWRCSPLAVPGALVDAVYADGDKIETAKYEVLREQGIIRWIPSSQPQQVAVTIRLTQSLTLGTETDRWKRLAIILPVIATILSALITAGATYLTKVDGKTTARPQSSSALSSPAVEPRESDGVEKFYNIKWSAILGGPPIPALRDANGINHALGFQISGTNIGGTDIRLESAEIISGTTGEHMQLLVGTSEGEVSISRINPIPPGAAFGLSVDFGEKGKGIPENIFMEKWGIIKVVVKFDGHEYVRNFDYQEVLRRFNGMRPGSPSPHVTTRG